MKLNNMTIYPISKYDIKVRLSLSLTLIPLKATPMNICLQLFPLSLQVLNDESLL